MIISSLFADVIQFEGSKKGNEVYLSVRKKHHFLAKKKLMENKINSF